MICDKPGVQSLSVDKLYNSVVNIAILGCLILSLWNAVASDGYI